MLNESANSSGDAGINVRGSTSSAETLKAEKQMVKDEAIQTNEDTKDAVKEGKTKVRANGSAKVSASLSSNATMHTNDNSAGISGKQSATGTSQVKQPGHNK